jgi:hypothetical protein
MTLVTVRPLAIKTHRTAFIPIPKCGSSSLRELIKGVGSRDVLEIDKQELIKPIYNRWRKIVILREPIQRLISCWRRNVVQSIEGSDLEAFGVKEGMPFADFAEIVCSVPDEEAEQHFRSQHWFVHQGGILMANEAVCLKDVSTFFGSIDWLPSFPHKNKTTPDDLQIDDALMGRLFERYIKDYELLSHFFSCEEEA